MKFKHVVLHIHKLIFSWYYKRVPEHFQKWTFIKSVKLLIQNYEHNMLLYDNMKSAAQGAGKDAREARNELYNFRMQVMAGDAQINSLNSMFGTDINKPTEN